MDSLPLLMITAAIVIYVLVGRFTLQTRPLAPVVPTPELIVSHSPEQLSSLAVRLADQTDTQTMLRMAGEWLHQEYAIPLIVIYSYDLATHELIDPIVIGPQIPTLLPRLRLGIGIYGEVAATRQARFVEHLAQELRFGPTAGGMQVAYVIPLVHSSSLFGVLAVQSDRSDGLRESECSVLDRAAALIGAVAAATIRFSNSRQAIMRFDRFQTLAQRLTNRLDSNQLLQEIVEAAREMLDTQMSALLDLKAETGELRPIAWAGITAETAMILFSRYKEDLKGLVAWARRPARTADLMTDQRTTLATQAVVAGMQSELAVPVLYLDKLYGVLAVQTDQHRHFTDEEMDLLSSLSSYAGIALRNAQLFERLQLANRQLETTIADLEISQQQAENARLSAVEANNFKTVFINNMSHELRTPLNAVINFTRIVADGHVGLVTPEQSQYLTYVYDSGQHLLGLINDILDLAKIEAGKMEIHCELTNLEPILHGVMSTAVGLTRDKKLTLRQEIAPDLPKLNIDGTRIRQVLLNLLSNAAKFTIQGGITVRAERRDGQVVVAVQDTGIGIKAEDLPTGLSLRSKSR